jgi:hypothetical protein
VDFSFPDAEIENEKDYVPLRNVIINFIKNLLQNLELDNTIKLEKCANHESLTNRWKKSHTNKGGVYMATSSITKNFIISGKEQVEMFADAIEASANNRPKRVPVSAREITDEAELIEFMKKWEKANVGRR